MKLEEMGKKANYARMNKIFESRFGFKIDFNKLTLSKAQKLAHKINENLSAVRKSHGIHTAEQSPKYMELLMVNETLNKWIDEKSQLTEGELGQAEVILAAKSMVDSVQDMIEKVGKLQNEELPPLLDTIKDQIGTAQADQFKQAAFNALTSLSQQLSASREALDNGTRALTGEATPDMAMGGQAPVAPGDATMPAGEVEPAAGEEAMPTDAFAATDAAAGGAEPVGREKR